MCKPAHVFARLSGWGMGIHSARLGEPATYGQGLFVVDIELLGPVPSAPVVGGLQASLAVHPLIKRANCLQKGMQQR